MLAGCSSSTLLSPRHRLRSEAPAQFQACHFQLPSMSTQRLDLPCTFSRKDTSRSQPIRPVGLSVEKPIESKTSTCSLKQNIRLPPLATSAQTTNAQTAFIEAAKREIKDEFWGEKGKSLKKKRFAEQGSVDESCISRAKRKRGSSDNGKSNDILEGGGDSLSLGQLGAGNFWFQPSFEVSRNFTGLINPPQVPFTLTCSGDEERVCYVPGEVIQQPLSNNPWVNSVVTEITVTDLGEKDGETSHGPVKEASGSSTSSESQSLGLRLHENVSEQEVGNGSNRNPYSYDVNEVEAGEEDNNNQVEHQGFELVSLLIACVEAIGVRNTAAIHHFIAKLGELASPKGSPISRLSTYYTEALAIRVTRLWPQFFHINAPRELDRVDDESGTALRLLNQVSPIPKFLHFTSNEILLRAFEGKDRVHIIDFDIKQGLQWPSLFQSLASRTNPPSHVRITGIGESKQELNETGDRLAGFAEALNLPFEFHPVVDRLEDVRLWMLHVKEQESVAVNCIFQMHKTLYDGTGGALRDFLEKFKGYLDRLEGTNLTVVVENEEQVELSFTRVWDPSLKGNPVPLTIDKRFVMLRGSSGFYSYAIYEHLAESPAFDLDNTRIALKLRKDKFRYMAIADNRQRFMPLPEDRLPPRGQTLAYPEAVRLVNPVEPEFTGEVDDKYEYSSEAKDIRVHGWVSADPPVGFWQITPSFEFRSAGPSKQFLNSHDGPTSLSVFHSTHYAGEDLIMKFGPNEPWKKVYGPVFMYLNSLTSEEGPNLLWEDAKKQVMNEVQTWPYDFPASVDFPSSDQRGNVSGRLLVHDRYICENPTPGIGSYVGLALPGDVGSWQRECKGYQFWTIANEDGYFSIKNVRTGVYNLYAWVPGVIGDYRYDVVINITSGLCVDVGNLVYEPPRDGPTLWEIGIPDRTAAEFYVPDPNPLYINKLYVNHPDRFRQYGLWERYAELYPDGDLVYTIGNSDYRKDWFFAQVTRKTNNNTYEGTTWQIRFKLDNVDESATYKLRVALATAHSSELQVRINDPMANPLFTSGVIGKDNTIARHGIHGLYWLFEVKVPGTHVVEGNNTIFLTQPLSTSPFQGVMYDYIRLEGPSPSNSSKNP